MAIAEPEKPYTSPPRERQSTRKGGSFAVLVALGLALVALLLRVHGIGHESLWLDEGYTLLFSQLPLPRLISVGGAHDHPPLYYLLVHTLLWARHSYLIPRYVSAVAGALSVLVMNLLGSRLFGRGAGVIAAALLTIEPLQVWYGQDGRGYALASLFVLLSYLNLLVALERNTPVRWAVYAGLTAATLYTEYTTILVLIPQALLLLQARRLGVTRRVLLSWLTVCLLFAPWLGILAGNVGSIAHGYWVPVPSASEVSNTFLQFVGLVTPCPSPPCSGHLLVVPLLAAREGIIAVVMAIVALTVLGGAVLARRLRVTIVALWLVLPFAVVLLLAVRRSLYLDRIFVDCSPALYLLLGAAAWRGMVSRSLSRRLLGLGLALAFGGCALANLSPIYAANVNPDWKSAARDFRAAYRPGQAVVYVPGALATLLASYLPPGFRPSRQVSLWSRDYLDVPGWQRRFPELVDPNREQRSAEEARLRNLQLATAARGQNGVWLITLDYQGFNDCRRWFTDHGFRILLSEIYHGDTRIEFWSRRSESSFGRPVFPAGSGSFPRGWIVRGKVSRYGSEAWTSGPASLSRTFAVTQGVAYSVDLAYRGVPGGGKPSITMRSYDRRGILLGTFPRTHTYDWPVNGVWLTQPFGFVAPPGAVSATLTLGSSSGESYWRDVRVYRER